ncbi:ComEA family DNA-binding protein [Streptosporangium sp. KLBMP 9127]|nr:ComEA family DNA-binding protein [Streptosporangium sp. KLBMP 9127]
MVTLPDGSRVTDAVEAAGGATRAAATRSLNLARRLIDGEQVIVGASTVPGALPLPGTVPGGAIGPGALVDLNSATAEQLDVLPGVGEVLARRIVEYRDGHGGFRSVEQLQDVSGIGNSKYADIKDKVRI